jgi:hypothetical protein
MAEVKSMIPITFSIKSSVPLDHVKNVLDEVAACHGVRVVEPLDPVSSVPEIQRMGFAYVEAEHDADNVIQLIQKMGSIKIASRPAARRLVNG